MASIRKYKTATAEPRFQVRWRDARGRDRCKTFKLRADAKRFLIDVERRQQLGPLYDAKAEYFGDFLDAWLGRYEQRVRPSSYERGVQALRRARPLAGFYVEQIAARDVDDVIAGVGKAAPRQAQIALALLKQVSRVRVSEGRRSTRRSSVYRLRVSMSVSLGSLRGPRSRSSRRSAQRNDSSCSRR